MKKRVVVIGSGPGGYPAALRAASLGADVTVVEKGQIGGVCLNCGCIPSKTLLSAAHNFEIAKNSFPSATPDWQKIIERKKTVVSKLQSGIESLFKAKKVHFLRGSASFISDKEILIKNGAAETKLDFDAAIIATGTEAFFLPPFAAERENFLDNKTVFEMPFLPKSITIVGGGAIGCEFSCMFSSLGAAVNLIEMQPSLLPSEDEGLTRVLTNSLSRQGVKIYASRKAAEAKIINGLKKITLDDGTVLESEQVLVAVGREARVQDLGLENIGVEFDGKKIKVDPYTLKAAENIYAVGDVNGLCLLAHAATRQGEIAAANILGKEEKYDNNFVPKAVYTRPEIVSVGFNKKTAEAAGFNVKVQKSFLLANGRALAQDESDGFVQLVSDAQTGKILGSQMACAGAAEIIHVVSVALQAGMTTEELKKVIFAHPTIAESIREAAEK